MRLVMGATIAHVVITLASVTRPSPSGTGLVSYRELVGWPLALAASLVMALASMVLGVLVLRHQARIRLRRPDDTHTPTASVADVALGPALATGLCMALMLGARGLVGPITIWIVAVLPALAVKSVADRLNWGTPDLPTVASRLRGASITYVAVGLVFFATSGSVIAAAALPLVIATRLPASPPPPLPATTDEASLTSARLPTESVDRRAGDAIHALLFTGSPQGPGSPFPDDRFRGCSVRSSPKAVVGSKREE